MIKVNPALDARKPLGLYDEAGFIVSDGQLLGGYNQNWLISRSVDTDSIRWQKKLASPLTMPLAKTSAGLLIGTRVGDIKLVDLQDGKTIWSQNLGYFSLRKPTVTATHAFVATVDQKLISLSLADGKTNWVYDAGQPTGLVINTASQPLIIDKTIVLGTSEGELHGINLETGQRLWVFDPGSRTSRFRDVIGEISLLQGQLIVSRYDGLVTSIKLTGATPKQIWQKQFTTLSSSHYRDGTYFVSALNGDFVALEASSGRELWRSQLGQGANVIFPTETVIYVGGTKGGITALDSHSGKVLWHDFVSGSLHRYPIISEDTLYFATGRKVLYGYRIK